MVNLPGEKKKGLAITIDGTTYEVSNDFAKKHPGGCVILEYDGKEASDVFHSFHSSKAFDALKYFKKLPTQHVEQADQETLDFRALREEVRKEGLMDSSAAFYIWKTSSCTAMLAAAGALCVYYPGKIWSIVSAAFLLGSGMSQCGWLAHDYLHHQVFKDRKWNNILGQYVGCVLQGFSPTWWKDKHNTHHAVCNIHGHDPDISTVPIIAWSDMDVPLVKKIPSAWQHWLRHQVFLLPFILCFAQLSWRIQSIIVGYSSKTREPIFDRISLLIHYSLLGFITYSTSEKWYHGALFLALQEVFGSYGKALPFILNHGGCPTIHEDNDLSFLRLQVVTSRDVYPSLFMDWFMGGLNFQVEHHLFPTMPRHNLIKVKPRVIALAKKHNIPYLNCGFGEGFMQVVRALSKIAAEF